MRDKDIIKIIEAIKDIKPNKGCWLLVVVVKLAKIGVNV